jgi:glycosyltransferase involved in cell wall biosynthesis
MREPLFSIIIGTYNRAQFIRATLDSVCAQDFADYEVIVVDDGSTDNTLEVLREFPWVKVISRENGGPGAARNCGVRASVGEYIAFLDSDDIWFPWTLATFANVIEQNGRPDLVAAKLKLFWDDGELREVRREPMRVEVFKDYFESSRRGYFVGACMMVVRKSLFDEVGGFIERRVYAEDCDLALRLGLAKGFAQIHSPVTFGYRQHASNARRNHALIYEGTMNLVLSEERGAYPGGLQRRADRLRLITLHVRPFSVECARIGKHSKGWALYLKTLAWHLQLGRWKYIMGLPALLLLSALGFRPESAEADPAEAATSVHGDADTVSGLQ